MKIAAPGYWMDETSGALRPAVEAYLNGQEMTVGQIGAMRAYFRQWMDAPTWAGDLLQLRADIEKLTDRRAINEWLNTALELGIDPL